MQDIIEGAQTLVGHWVIGKISTPQKSEPEIGPDNVIIDGKVYPKSLLRLDVY